MKLALLLTLLSSTAFAQVSNFCRQGRSCRFSLIIVSGTGTFGGAVTGLSFTSTAASGANAFITEQGARFCMNGSACTIRMSTDGTDTVFISNNLRISGSLYYAVKQILPVSQAIDFNVATQTCDDSAGITVTGAADGNTCRVSAPAAAYTPPDISYACYVSAANTVIVRACCGTGAPGCDPASASFTVAVEK